MEIGKERLRYPSGHRPEVAREGSQACSPQCVAGDAAPASEETGVPSVLERTGSVPKRSPLAEHRLDIRRLFSGAISTRAVLTAPIRSDFRTRPDSPWWSPREPDPGPGDCTA